MTIIMNDLTAKEEVVRFTQYGVRFPDGSVLWATIDQISGNRHQALLWGGTNYYVDIHSDVRRSAGWNTFIALEERYLAQIKEIKAPSDETSLLERVKRSVMVVFDAPGVIT